MASKDVPKQPDDSDEGDRGKPGKNRFPGQEILAGASPKEILARIVEGDPLDVYLLSQDRMTERAFMLDGHRLTLRSMARIAYHGKLYRGEPPLDLWISERIDEAIKDLVSEDRADEMRRIPADGPEDDRYSFLAELIDAPIDVARTICVRFNNLREKERKAFYAIYVLGKSFNRYVAEGNGPPSHLRQLLRTAAEAFVEHNVLKFPELDMDDIPRPTDAEDPPLDDFRFDDSDPDEDQSEGGN
jgi:hypothetical protein